MQNRHLNILALFIFIGRSIRSILLLFAGLLFIPTFKIIGFVLAAYLLISSFIKYATFAYTLGEKELLIKSGLIFKKERHVPYERIQNIQSHQWFFLKPFNLESVTIDTGAKGKNESKLSLEAVNVNIATEIEKRRKLAHAGDDTAIIGQSDNIVEEHQHITEQPQEEYNLKWIDLLVFAITSGNILTEFFVLYSFGDRWHINKYIEKYFDQIEGSLKHASILLIIVLIILVVMVLMLVSVIQVILKYYQFTLTRTGNNIIIKRGLIQTNTMQLSIHRIQAVEFRQTLLRQIFGLLTVKIHLIADRRSDDEKRLITLIPVLKKSIAYSTVHRFVKMIPEIQPKLKPGSPYMMWLFARNGLLIVMLVAAFVAVFYHGIFWWIITAIFLLLSIGNGIYKGYYTDARQLNDDQLVLRTAALLDNKTLIVGWHEIQSMKTSQSIWMKKRHRMHLILKVRSGNNAEEFSYRYLTEQQVQMLFNWYRGFA